MRSFEGWDGAGDINMEGGEQVLSLVVETQDSANQTVGPGVW